MTVSLSVRVGLQSFHTTFSRAFSPPKHPQTLAFKPRFSSSTIAMSSEQIVEHVVLFKIKPDTDPSRISAMLAALNDLTSLDSVLHLSAGPIRRNRTPALGYTHLLHSRYASKEDLGAYTNHPDHVGVVKGSVLPICEDVMAVDWIAEDFSSGEAVLPVGSALRLSFLKLKEGLGEEVKSEVLAAMEGVRDELPGIRQLSVGENFSPARAKGFSIASVAVYPGTSEMEFVDSNPDITKARKDKVRDYLEGLIVLDYVVSLHQSASL